MPQLKEKYYTAEDYWNLPEGERAELIDGQLYAMAPPAPIHQELVSELTQAIGRYIKDRNGNCKVYPAPMAVILNEDDETYVEPDISVICDKSKITDKGCIGAPDFIIEIVSPASRKMDYLVKSTKYQEAGVQEYWIVDPMKKRTTIYRFGKDETAPMIASFSQPLAVGIYDDLEITIAELLD